jgi:DNA-binding NarL/FixJ family response regulator
VTVAVVVADDQPLMRSALAVILTGGGIDVVGEAGSGDEAVAVVRRTRPDVVLMDVRMPGRDGLSATAELVVGDRPSRVLVLTTFDHDEYLYGALRAGAAGFLLKNSTPEELVRAVHRVASGESVLDPAVTARVVARFTSRTRPDVDVDRLQRLTVRELDVLALLSRGMTNTEIAGALGVGEATAKTHVSHVLMKLGARDRVQAVIYAFESGFAPSDRRVRGVDESCA